MLIFVRLEMQIKRVTDYDTDTIYENCIVINTFEHSVFQFIYHLGMCVLRIYVT